jgi:hypothetical protein
VTSPHWFAGVTGAAGSCALTDFVPSGTMFISQAREPSFFRGETLKKDTPTLIVED